MRFVAALLVLFTTLLHGTVVNAGERILLAHPWPKEATYAARVVSLICADAFQQMGLDAEVRMYPPLRGAIEADAGRIDGEVGRAFTYGKDHPNLIRVEEPLLSFRVTAFTHIPGLKISGWDSLKGTPYRVEYRSGYTTFKANLERVLPAQQISSVVDSQIGLQDVALGRTDIFVDLEEFGQLQLARLQNRYGNVHNAGLVQDTPVYIYLHKRHAALVPRLAEILSKMKSSDAIRRHIATALSEERSKAP
jgi:polar amino acid transport system substrate-binding protein